MRCWSGSTPCLLRARVRRVGNVLRACLENGCRYLLHYSITSSVRASSEGGTVRPAVLNAHASAKYGKPRGSQAGSERLGSRLNNHLMHLPLQKFIKQSIAGCLICRRATLFLLLPLLNFLEGWLLFLAQSSQSKLMRLSGKPAWVAPSIGPKLHSEIGRSLCSLDPLIHHTAGISSSC